MRHGRVKAPAAKDAWLLAAAVWIGLTTAAMAGMPAQQRPSFVELANSRVAVRFSLESGAVTSISNRLQGVAYTVDGREQGLFALNGRVGNTVNPKALAQSSRTFVGHRLSRLGNVQAIEMDYRVAVAPGGEVKVSCRATLADDGSDIRWTIKIDNEARDTEIVEILFPILGGLRIGRQTADDVLMWPAWGGGRLIDQPQKNGRRHGMYVGGGAIMPWVDIFSRSADAEPCCGLYVASYDTNLLMTALYSAPAEDGNSLTLQMKKFARVRPGQSWTSPEFVALVHAGDWHAGADAYRAWFNAISARPDPPAWLTRCDGRLEWTLPLDGTGRFKQDVPEKVELARRFGLNFARFGGQMVASVSTGKQRCNRLPFPDPVMGTEEEFATVLKKVRDQGFRAAFYMNGIAWDPRWPRIPPGYEGKISASLNVPDWEGGFKRNALQRYDGSFYGQYTKASGHWPAPAPDSPYDCLFYFMCPASKGWQDHLHHWVVEKYLTQYNAGAMFLDQIGAESARYCCNPDHGHDHHGGAWAPGVIEMAKRIKQDARRIDPDFALETEGFGDVYAPYFDSFFIAPSSTGIWPDSHPEVVRYTFPEIIFFDGFWHIQNPAYTRTPEATLNEVFLMGNRFLVYAQPNVLTQHTIDVVNLRRRIKHVQYAARFMDDVGLAVSDPALRVKRFVLDEPDRKVTLLTVHNPKGVAGATIDVGTGALGPVGEAAAAVQNGSIRALETEVAGNRVRLSAPQAALSAVLLVHCGKDVIRQAREAEQVPPLAPREVSNPVPAR